MLMAAESPSWTNLLGMGIVVAAQLLVGMALGWFVDSQLDTGPAFLLVGLALGIVGAVAYTVMEFRQYLNTDGATTDNQQTDPNGVSEN